MRRPAQTSDPLMKKSSRSSSRPAWHPVFWTTWVAIFGLYLLSRLPMRTKQRWGKGIGLFLRKRLKSRAKVARTNIAACMPELDEQEREQLIDDSFVE